jgi:hypothetical protein
MRYLPFSLELEFHMEQYILTPSPAQQGVAKPKGPLEALRPKLQVGYVAFSILNGWAT